MSKKQQTPVMPGMPLPKVTTRYHGVFASRLANAVRKFGTVEGK